MKMPWINPAGRKYLYVLLVAFISHLVLINWIRSGNEPADVILSKDAISAVRRAKSIVCKKELKEHASQLDDIKIARTLRRRCNHDQDLPQFEMIGCISYKSNASNVPVIKLSEDVEDLNDCLETCFSFGHSYGGYHQSIDGDQCLCGDSAMMDSSKNCDTTDDIRWFKVNQGIFFPNATECASRTPRKGAAIQIAFILTLKGRSSMQVKRLLRNIYSLAHIYYLHVDDNDDFLFQQLLPLELKYNNILVARSRFETIWGGPRLLTAIIDAFEHLSVYNWSYVINLSESDFPIKPLRDLEAYLQSKDCIFLRAHNLKGYKFIKKQGLNRNFYQCERRVWRIGRRKLPKGIIYTGGSDWFALPRSFSDYIIMNKHNSDGLVAPLLQLFNYTLLPAESFFHTMALNSEFCDKFAYKNLRVNNWRRNQGCKCQQRAVVDWCGCSPHVYRSSDIKRLTNFSKSQDLFLSRKFDPTISQNIIIQVEQSLLERKPDIYLSNNYWLNIYSSEVREDLFSLDGLVSQQLGSLASSRIGLKLTELRTVHQYFEDDNHKAIVLESCNDKDCCQLLVISNPLVITLEGLKLTCGEVGPYKLMKLEVGHGFDPGERMFRDRRPLNTQSDLIVYHEWLVDNLNAFSKNLSAQMFQFHWIDPKGEVFSQDIKLRPATGRSRLSFAHRLNTKAPLDAGPWSLRIFHENTSCTSDYEFLVFSADRGHIKQRDFDKFFTVLDHCNSTAPTDIGSCADRKWSITQKRLIEDGLF